MLRDGSRRGEDEGESAIVGAHRRRGAEPRELPDSEFRIKGPRPTPAKRAVVFQCTDVRVDLRHVIPDAAQVSPANRGQQVGVECAGGSLHAAVTHRSRRAAEQPIARLMEGKGPAAAGGFARRKKAFVRIPAEDRQPHVQNSGTVLWRHDGAEVDEER